MSRGPPEPSEPPDEGQAIPLQGGRGVEGSAWSMAEGRVGSPGASRGVRDADEGREVGEAGFSASGAQEHEGHTPGVREQQRGS